MRIGRLKMKYWFLGFLNLLYGLKLFPQSKAKQSTKLNGGVWGGVSRIDYLIRYLIFGSDVSTCKLGLWIVDRRLWIVGPLFFVLQRDMDMDMDVDIHIALP